MTDERNDDFLKKDPLGEILIQRGLLKSEQLSQALAEQKKNKKLIGEILVERGLLQDIDIVVALVIQCSLPYLAVNKFSLDPNVVALIPKEKAKLWSVVLLDKVGAVLSVVMANPLDKTVCQELRQITGCKLALFIATKSQIDQAIERAYL